MKKQIALIIISLLAALPVTAHQNNNNRMCVRHDTNNCSAEKQCGFDWEEYDLWKDLCFDICNKPCCGLIPTLPEKPVVQQPSLPQKPETPQEPQKPEIPQQPQTPEDTVLPDGENVESTPLQKSEISVLLELVNEAREKSGMKALTYDTALEKCAAVRASEIKVLFSHTRPNGLSCFTVLDENGYDYSHAGENIAYGQKDAHEVFNAWMNSQGHRENILSPSYTKIGMGLNDGGTLYWSQFFAG